MFKIKLLDGLTLIEIIVSIVIFTLVLTGLTGLFISGKNIILHSFYRLGGGELGRLFLDPLQMHVRQDTWDNAVTNDLSLGMRYCGGASAPQAQSCASVPQRTLRGREYSGTYEVYGFGGGLDLRRVYLTINWPES